MIHINRSLGRQPEDESRGVDDDRRRVVETKRREGSVKVDEFLWLRQLAPALLVDALIASRSIRWIHVTLPTG